MTIITFLRSSEPSGQISFKKKCASQNDKTLYQLAKEQGLPVASSCSGEGICGKCDMKIVEGEENLSPMEELEKKLLQKEKRPKGHRISCQTIPQGNCTVTTTYW